MFYGLLTTATIVVGFLFLPTQVLASIVINEFQVEPSGAS